MPNYKISEQNFNEIQRTLGVLLGHNTTPQQKNMLMQISGLLNRAKPIDTAADKELLTDTKMQELLGTNTYGAIYFNFDTNAWNRNEYMNTPIKYIPENTMHAHEFKQILESNPTFQDIEIVAYIIMTIDDKRFIDYDPTIQSPTHSPNGDFIVGNIVQRNKKSGQILPLNPTWTCHGRCGSPEKLCKNIGRFSIHMNWPKYLDALISTQKKQR